MRVQVAIKLVLLPSLESFLVMTWFKGISNTRSNVDIKKWNVYNTQHRTPKSSRWGENKPVFLFFDLDLFFPAVPLVIFLFMVEIFPPFPAGLKTLIPCCFFFLHAYIPLFPPFLAVFPLPLPNQPAPCLLTSSGMCSQVWLSATAPLCGNLFLPQAFSAQQHHILQSFSKRH